MTPTANELNAHRAQTDRLARLADFAGRFAPAFGEACGDGRDPIDAETPLAILRARNAALQAAFEGIERIARQS